MLALVSKINDQMVSYLTMLTVHLTHRISGAALLRPAACDCFAALCLVG